MSDGNSQWIAGRNAHLIGGCRAANIFDEKVEFLPPTISGRTLSFRSKSYGSLYADLSKMDVAPIGFEFLTNSLEAQKLLPTNWRSFHPWGGPNLWPCNDQMDVWSQIAYVAAKEQRAVLWDLARRVSHQLRVTAWRLFQLSEAYYEQLRVRISKHEAKSGDRFEDGFTWLGYLAVQSFLVDACILRDYLAEFIYYFVVPDSERPSAHVTTMAGFRKVVLKNDGLVRPLFRRLESDTSIGGWLYVLGAYRDLAVHCVPLARAESKLWALTVEVPIKGAEPLVGLSLPLPASPSVISSERSAAGRVERLERELRLLTSASRGELESSDALVYCYLSLDKLTRLTSELVPFAPVRPRIPVLTERDIIGEIKVERI